MNDERGDGSCLITSREGEKDFIDEPSEPNQDFLDDLEDVLDEAIEEDFDLESDICERMERTDLKAFRQLINVELLPELADMELLPELPDTELLPLLKLGCKRLRSFTGV